MIRARDAELGIGYTPQQYDNWVRSYHARQLGSMTSSRKARAAVRTERKGGRPKKAVTA